MRTLRPLRRFAARHARELAAYGVLGLALWPVPLLGLVHVEGAAVVAVGAYFISGFAATGSFQRAGRSFWAVLGAQEALLAVPLVLLTATLAWRPNCDYARGLLLFAAMPPVTVAFAVGLAFALTGATARFCKTTLAAAGLCIGLGGAVWDLGFHPQFYTYNHLFGGVLGPIYDRELALRPGFFAFRTLTLVWAGLFSCVGAACRRKGRRRARALGAAAAAGLLVAGAYANATRLGFNTPASKIQRVLGGHRQTAHFDLYYDPDSLPEGEVDRLAWDHEWHFRRLRERMGIAPEERVASYLYPSEDTKARLTGARRTSVAPVWLGRPQVHLLQSAYTHSFGHELAHAFSRAFGLPLVKASRSVGLVEGLAVAFEPPGRSPSPADQVSAARLLGAGDGSGRSLAEDVAARLSPLGFWTGRGAVGYTTMGAFVRFLVERYGAAKLRAVYAWANFEEVYGKPVRALAEEWEAALRARRSVAEAAGALAERRFSRPSLFEEACPHYVPPWLRAYRRGRDALAAGDTVAAREALHAALARQPSAEGARVALARLRLSPGDALAPEERAAQAVRLLSASPDSAHGPAFYATQADAEALRGRPARARRRYDRALGQLPAYRSSDRALLFLRRALAERPRLVAAVAGAEAPLKEARRLRRRAAGSSPGDSLGSPPAAQALRAWLLAGGEQYARAARLLGRTDPEAEWGGAEATEAVRRQRRAWLARWWYRAGRPARAEEEARAAAAAYRAFGDYDAAAYWAAFAGKMQWREQATAPLPD